MGGDVCQLDFINLNQLVAQTKFETLPISVGNSQSQLHLEELINISMYNIVYLLLLAQ